MVHIGVQACTAQTQIYFQMFDLLWEDNVNVVNDWTEGDGPEFL